MTVTIELSPDIEAALVALAKAAVMHKNMTG